jgi:hypothetical protein
MQTLVKNRVLRRGACVAAFAVLLGGVGAVWADDVKVKLSGDQEVPPVKTSATGEGTISVGADKSVSGSIKVSGVQATAAHIHEGAPGANGGVAVPLTKGADGAFTVPAGAKLSDAQYAAYKAGNLYVNVHSDANPGGELRGQLKGK